MTITKSRFFLKLVRWKVRSVTSLPRTKPARVRHFVYVAMFRIPYIALIFRGSKISRKAVFDIFRETLSTPTRVGARYYASRHDSMGRAQVTNLN